MGRRKQIHISPNDLKCLSLKQSFFFLGFSLLGLSELNPVLMLSIQDQYLSMFLYSFFSEKSNSKAVELNSDEKPVLEENYSILFLSIICRPTLELQLAARSNVLKTIVSGSLFLSKQNYTLFMFPMVIHVHVSQFTMKTLLRTVYLSPYSFLVFVSISNFR